MRIAFSRWPTVADGQRYLRRLPTSDRDGPAGSKTDTYRKAVQTNSEESMAAAFERLRLQLLNYDIFSPRVVGYRVLPQKQIAVGCTVIQRLGLGVIFLESATRVVDVWDTTAVDGSRAAGFAYVTVQGHPERGVATFEVRQEGQAVLVVLTARSIPGTRLTKLGSPITRLVQRAITRRAVGRLTTAT